MKKALLAAGTFTASLIAMAVLLFSNFPLIMCGFYPAPLITPVLAAFGTAGLCKKLCGKYGMSAWVFWILAFLPQVIAGAGAVAVFCLGPFENIYAVLARGWNCYVFAATGLVYGISGAVFTLLSVRKLRKVRQ